MEIIYTKYMKALIDYDGIARRETYFFPHDAFRELLLNALIHKDYMKTAPIQIQIFKDKIDIWNIGKMPDDMTIQDLFKKHRSDPRNPNIAGIFFRCGYIESWGRGYFKIQTLCKEVNADLPLPELLNGGLSVVCNAGRQYLALAAKYGIDGSGKQVTEQVTEQVRRLVDCLRGRPLSVKEILIALNLKHRPTLMQEYIAPALEKGLVEMTQPASPRSPTQKYRLTEKGNIHLNSLSD